MKHRKFCRFAAVLATAGLCLAARAQDEVSEPELQPEPETIEVFARSPIGPAQGDAQRATSNLQTLSKEALSEVGLRSVGDALQKAGSVFRTDATGNPFQPDLFYRGYSISPLLGLPQGLAVYQDGVRVNEPFGDTVNFDLIPLVALASADLVPGSNPVFGRNALGGALALRTKSGFDSPGGGLDLSAGEFGRLGATAEVGVAAESLALYLAAEAHEEDGWRDFSDSRAARAFARGTWLAGPNTQLDLTVSGADNRLRGNGATPRELIEAEGRDAVFTHPDQTAPRMAFVNLLGSHKRDDGARVSGNAYFRRNRIRTFNGDGTEFEACEDPTHVDGSGQPFLCEEEDEGEEVVEDRSGVPIVADGSNDSATQNRSRTAQDGYGLSAQFEQRYGAHQLAFGLTADFGDIRFDSSTELARLDASRGTVGSGITAAESVVDVNASNDSLGAYLMDSWKLGERLELSVAGRWTRTVIELRDQIPDGDLSGRHRYARFNPMLGYAWELAPGWTQFASLAQAARAPTPVELTCANPDDPCRLPNGFVDDPPLDEVVTRTLEVGLRHRGRTVSGSAALFHAVSRDDILFITDGELANQGYFDNVGDTLRQGLEASLQWVLGRGFSAGAQLTALTAEFREDFLVNTPNHPLRDPLDPAAPDPSTREVRSGDRIPLTPRLQYRLALDWSGRGFDLGIETVGRGDSRFRGDEANVDASKLGGFAVLNAQAAWQCTPQLTVYASADNLLDREFETFGVYGEADEVLGESYEDARRFVGAGSPRRFQGGLRLRF